MNEFNEIQHKFDWLSFILGVLLLFLGILVLDSPSKTLNIIAVLVGIGAIIKGVYTLWFRKLIEKFTDLNLLFLIISAIVDIIIGIIFILKIDFGIVVLAYIFSFWFIFDSIIQLITDQIFKSMNRTYFDILVFLNIMTLILGIILLFNPLLSIYTLIYLISFYLLFIGITKIIESF